AGDDFHFREFRHRDALSLRRSRARIAGYSFLCCIVPWARTGCRLYSPLFGSRLPGKFREIKDILGRVKTV
ncbi:MAG: hypothetical protein K9K39_09705, partial [Desulfohalobiaceae bacterium]|nr:hypothetical protein [Desulfohalobiaceae bacterium]